MTQSTDAASSEPRVRPRLAVAVAAIGALDLALVTVLMLLDRVQVQSQQELAAVGLGMPLNWVTQDQGIDPPLPWRVSFMSPWENPTTIAWLPLIANMIIVGLLLTGVWFGVSRLRVRR